jgi:hypothetical protein
VPEVGGAGYPILLKEAEMVTTDKRVENCRAYIASQFAKADKKGQREADIPPGPSVTLSRMTGAGAVALAQKLADYLAEHDKKSTVAWTVFDKNLVRKVLEDHDLPARLERFMPEDKPKMDDAFTQVLGLRPYDGTLFAYTRDTIYRLARMGNVILVGRGCNIITRDLDNVLRLRLVASLEKRIPRCQETYNLTRAEAEVFIRKEDRARRQYMRAYFDVDIDNPLHYDMVINLDDFTDELFVKVVAQTVLWRYEVL